MILKLRVITVFLAVVTAACNSGEQPKKNEAKESEPVTGLHALYQMFTSARAWAPDVEVYSVKSTRVEGVHPQPGKAGGWQVTFVSPSLQQSRLYTFSVADVSISLRQGVNVGKPESWSGSHGSQQPFRIQAAKTDSDDAYAVAAKKGGDYPAKHLDSPITYQLEQTADYNNAAWRVIWGESASSSDFSILVDATTGTFVKTLH